MIDTTRDLTARKLKGNFSYWVSKLGKSPPVVEAWDFVLHVPVTHTFGAWRKWGQNGEKEEFPYKNILFRDNRLISDHHRYGEFFKNSGSIRRKMTRARKSKLNRFVFAYHGIHDPYYARSNEIDVAAFGVFIKTHIERFPRCHATRRDLDSREAESPPNREFLLPDDARLLIKYQVTYDKRHRGDFWHYWGSENYFRNSNYANTHWHWKAEFHFFKEVPLKAIDAILWPFEIWGRQRQFLIGGNRLKQDFESRHPSCKVIPYHWSNLEPTFSLIRASFAVARYLSDFGKYPESAEIALENI